MFKPYTLTNQEKNQIAIGLTNAAMCCLSMNCAPTSKEEKEKQAKTNADIAYDVFFHVMAKLDNNDIPQGFSQIPVSHG